MTRRPLGGTRSANGASRRRGALPGSNRRRILATACRPPGNNCRRRVGGESFPEQLERLLFQTKYGVAVDVTVLVQLPPRASQRRQLQVRLIGARRLFHAKVQRVAEPATAGVIRARLLGRRRRRRVQRIDQQHAGTEPVSPLCKLPQVGRIAQAPTAR